MAYSESKLIVTELFSGGVAGTAGVFIGMPLDFIKTRCQIFPELFQGPIHCFLHTVRTEGLLAFYRGALSPLSAQFPVNALAFAGESFAMRILNASSNTNNTHTNRNDANLTHSCIAGGFAGFLTCLATVPTDYVKILMQSDRARTQPLYNTTFDCVRDIFNRKGFMGFSRGFNITVIRDVPSFAAYFFCYESLIRHLPKVIGNSNIDNDNEPSTSVILISGGTAGMASWGFVYPFDVAKSVIQSKPDGKELHWFKILKDMRMKYGTSSLFRGMGTVLLRAFPVNSITFLCYEQMRKVFSI